MDDWLGKIRRFLCIVFLCGIFVPLISAKSFADDPPPLVPVDENAAAPTPLKVTIPNLQEIPDAPLPQASVQASTKADDTPSDAASSYPTENLSDINVGSSVGEVANQLLAKWFPEEHPAVALDPEIILALNDVTPTPSADGQSTIIQSPGIIIHREVEHLTDAPTPQQSSDNTNTEQMAALSPAAGDNGPTPLIALPATATPAAPAAAEQPQPKPPETTQQPAPEAPPQTVSVNLRIQDIEPLLEKEEKADKSEPQRQLSPESKKILAEVPSHMGENSQKPEPFSIDHAKDVPNLKASQDVSVSHEAMGIKIEVKTPRFDANYELQRAYDAVLAGQNETAIAIYKSVLDNDPTNENALFGLATMYHRAGQIDLARPLYERLLAIDPDNRDGLNNFLVLLGDEAPEAALPQMQKLEERNPGFSPIPAQMAVLYQKLGDYDKAIDRMMAAIKLAPENLTYRYNLAIMLDKQGRFDEAADLYRQIIEASLRGDSVPGNIDKIQQRLTFISSNRP